MTASAEREYVKLIARRRPRAIRSKAAYEKALREIEKLMTVGKSRTRAQTEYYRLLCALVSDYERTVAASWPRLSPTEMLRELMDLKSISQARVARALGDRAAASSILTGRRTISKSQARKLAQLLAVDAGLFI